MYRHVACRRDYRRLSKIRPCGVVLRAALRQARN
jgi:hypothetical protein